MSASPMVHISGAVPSNASYESFHGVDKPDFLVRMSSTAIVVVFIELWAIAWIQNKYMETPFWRASFQVVLGGALVFATGILIGSA